MNMLGSMYSLILGSHPNAAFAVACAMADGVSASDLKNSRIMDGWFSNDGTEAVILSRTGSGETLDETVQKSLDKIRASAGFVSDSDEKYDTRYRQIRMKVPEPYLENTKKIADYMSAINWTEDKCGMEGLHTIVLTGELKIKDVDSEPELLEEAMVAVGSFAEITKAKYPEVFEEAKRAANEIEEELSELNDETSGGLSMEDLMNMATNSKH